MLLYNAYYGANEGRKTNLTREEIIKTYRKEGDPIGDGELIIYCPLTDSYVNDSFMDYFFDAESTFAKLMFDDGAFLLERLGEDKFKWNLDGDIFISTPNDIILSHSIKKAKA